MEKLLFLLERFWHWIVHLGSWNTF